MALSVANAGWVLQHPALCGCQLKSLRLDEASSRPFRAPLRQHSRHSHLQVRAAENADSNKEGGSTPLRAPPPRPGAAPPKMGAAPPKAGAAPPKMGPRPQAGPAPRPTAPTKPADAPKPMQGPQTGPSVTTVKSPFGESSMKSPFAEAKPKSIFGDSDTKPKSPFGDSAVKKPFGESGAAKPAGKRVKIGTGSGTMSPYGKSTTSARYKPQAGAYPGRMPPDFGDAGAARTTTKPSTFRPDSSLFAEKSRIELKQDAKDAEKKWVITRGQVFLGLSFVFSIVLMLGTFYLVYKVGGVHFNE